MTDKTTEETIVEWLWMAVHHLEAGNSVGAINLITRSINAIGGVGIREGSQHE